MPLSSYWNAPSRKVRPLRTLVEYSHLDRSSQCSRQSRCTPHIRRCIFCMALSTSLSLSLSLFELKPCLGQCSIAVAPNGLTLGTVERGRNRKEPDGSCNVLQPVGGDGQRGRLHLPRLPLRDRYARLPPQNQKKKEREREKKGENFLGHLLE